MVVLNQINQHTVQGMFQASVAALSLKNTPEGSELTITLKVSGDEVSEIAANLSLLARRVKVILEGEAQQLELW